jgi:ribosomal protein L40E
MEVIMTSTETIDKNGPTKICPTCNAAIPIDAKECPECGEKFDMPVKEEPKKLHEEEKKENQEDEMLSDSVRTRGMVGAGLLLMIIGFVTGPLIVLITYAGNVNVLSINTNNPFVYWVLFALGTIVGFLGLAIMAVGLTGGKEVKEIVDKKD